jgi:NhaA family Na+:H+ antiporter
MNARESHQAANKSDTPAALALMLAVALAMLLANSPLGPAYRELLAYDLKLGLGPLALTKTVLHWINDGLMAIFFLLVGIEIKRECTVGELASLNRAALPAVGALGGMLVPALVYLAFNHAGGAARAGWPIPTATDIAFALGVLALAGPRAPASLRIFLLALAVIDDLGAIVLIAVLFTTGLSWQAMVLGFACLALLVLLNRLRVQRYTPYVLVGFLLWLAVLKSGVHATLAGVVLGLLLPSPRASGPNVAARFERALHPWVTFVILPLFALANAGVPLAGLGVDVLLHPVTSGIAVGLLAGKLAGVFGFSWLAVRLGVCRLPEQVTWTHLFGVALLTGIGFTMSLFIGSLAFSDDGLHGEIRLGVLVGSSCAAIAGLLWLRMGPKSHSATRSAGQGSG